MHLKVSAIIPAYNTSEWIGECIESLINQTEPFYEILIIDDHSTDSTLAIAKEYESKNPIIKVYEQNQNHGPGYTRNYGLSKASGNYILFIDSDDLIRIDAVEVLLRKASQISYDAIYFDAESFGLKEYCKTSNYHRAIFEPEIDGISGKSFFDETYPNGYFASPCLCLYKKAIIDKYNIRFPEGVFYEDEYFSFVFIQSAQSVCYKRESFYKRRYREGSTVTSKSNYEKFTDYHKCFCLINRYIFEKYGHELSDAMRQYVFDLYIFVLDIYPTLKHKPHSSEWTNYIHSFDKLLGGINYYRSDNLGLLLALEHILTRESQSELRIHDKTFFVKRIHARIDELYREMLGNIPLGEKKIHIGVYGNGNHTNGLYTAYQYYYGDIKAKISIITSENIIKYDASELDYIFISSFKYGNEMYATAKRYFDRERILFVYDSLYKDVFSRFDEHIQSKLFFDSVNQNR